MTQHIALYGKGGVGKTTLVSNIGAALVEAGFTVAFGGSVCSEVRTVADVTKDLTVLEQAESFERNNPEFVLYEISADGSFAHLHAVMREIDINRLFVVTTADFRALQAANDVFGFLAQHDGKGRVPIPMGGLILNCIANSLEDALVNDYACHSKVRTIGKIPWSLVVRQSELYGSTVIESSPQSNQSYYYRRLAHQIVDAAGAQYSGNMHQPMSTGGLRAWRLEWADRIYALENGLVSDGEAI